MVSNILLALGVIVFAIGYFKKSRNIMLVGAVLLVCGAGYENLSAGFQQGAATAVK